MDGEDRRENVAHVVHAACAAVPGPAKHPAFRMSRSLSGEEADGQRYAVDRIADHSTLPDGTLRVQVNWTGYRHPTWRDALDAPQENMRVYLRRAAHMGKAQTSAYPPPTTSRNAGPTVGAAAGVGVSPPPAVRARPLGSARRSGATGGGAVGFLGVLGPLGRSDQRTRGAGIARQRHDEQHAPSGHK